MMPMVKGHQTIVYQDCLVQVPNKPLGQDH